MRHFVVNLVLIPRMHFFAEDICECAYTKMERILNPLWNCFSNFQSVRKVCCAWPILPAVATPIRQAPVSTSSFYYFVFSAIKRLSSFRAISELTEIHSALPCVIASAPLVQYTWQFYFEPRAILIGN
jgi:hypothetical protein